jgi:hypothetical protein
MLWGALLGLFGVAIEFSVMKAYIAVIAISILSVSNLIIYFAFQRSIQLLDGVCRIAAYIMVFYEKRFDGNRDESDNSWETTLFEIDMDKERSEEIEKKWHVSIKESFILAILSTGMILSLSIYLIVIKLNTETSNDIKMCIFLIFSLAALVFSIALVICIIKYGPSSYNRRKIKWLDTFLKYAKKNGCDIKNKAVEKFG